VFGDNLEQITQILGSVVGAVVVCMFHSSCCTNNVNPYSEKKYG
jgi:hypothetical protein